MLVMRRAVIAACLLGVASAATWQGRDLGTTEVDEAALNVDRTVSGLKCEVAGAIEILKTQQMIIPEATCETIKNADGTETKRSKYVNMFGFKNYKGEPYDGQCDFFGGTPPLPEGLGWFIVLGCGTIFALLTSGMVWFSNKHVPEDQQTGNNSETFSAAGRTITAGLTAADVVSKWTWAATLLQSSNVAYKFGVSGPFWYAAGATVQIILFAIVAIEIKRKCPAIHTMLEVVQVRWGTAAHLTFLWFGGLSSLIVTAMLILGGSATVNALTGMDIYAASFLIPIAVVGYTAFGGLKGTYYASFTHTFIIYLVLVISIWKVYTGPSDIGSADKMYDHLSCAAERVRGIKGYPTGTNSNTSFLTFKSGGGLIFGIANVVGNFGTVFADQSYWQGAIACKASATWKGYLLGGVAWFAIPFCMATTFGLAGRALDLPITIAEAGNGLVPPAVGTHLLGEAGSFLIALQLFMAVTSTANSEQLAISSLYAYDVYKRYINPNATGQQIIFQSRVAIAAWAVFSGIIATILKELGIGLGWVYMMMGCCIGCAVLPITFALCWKDCTATGAIVGAWAGMISAFIGWFGFAAGANDGVITVATLGQDYPLVTGNLLSLCVSPLMAVGISLAQGGQNFDWALLENASSDYMVENDTHAKLKETGGQDSKEAMDRAMWITLRVGFGFSLILIPIWPLLALPQDPFSKSYFVFYVALSFIWGHIAMSITTFIPIYEYLYPDPEDVPQEADAAGQGKPADPAAPGKQEQVAGFYMAPPGTAPAEQMPMMQAAPVQMPMMQAAPVQQPMYPMQAAPMQQVPMQQMPMTGVQMGSA